MEGLKEMVEQQKRFESDADMLEIIIKIISSAKTQVNSAKFVARKLYDAEAYKLAKELIESIEMDTSRLASAIADLEAKSSELEYFIGKQGKEMK